METSKACSNSIAPTDASGVLNSKMHQMQIQQQPQQVAGAMQMNKGAADQPQQQQQQQQHQQQQPQQQQTTQPLFWMHSTPQGHRQYFKLDPQTHQKLQAMDAAQRHIVIQKLLKWQAAHPASTLADENNANSRKMLQLDLSA
ncbi:Hypothetical predicted protein [Cloeon dipterum]|uniref:Uncharacterized protein n=1 Tax=Cloeon dipterum TaxID=197152 RepID=A0A8S1CUV7_9INSE|nr:Hypothetical predicted protein [Cloeon dipterum]